MKTDQRQQLLLAGALAVVGFFAADKLLITPLTGLWKKNAARIVRLQQDIAEGNGLIRRERYTLQDWDKIRQNGLPRERAAAEAILQNAVDRWEQESRIKIAGRKFQERTFPDDEYSTIECNLDASGTIESMTRLLYAIEKDPLPVRMEDLKVTAKDNNGSELLVTLRISGLVILSKD